MRSSAYVKAPLAITVGLLIFLLPTLTLLTTPVAFADVKSTAHGGGSNCYNCHVPNYPTTPDANQVHAIKNNTAWSSCGAASCHGTMNSSLLQNSVHKQVSCKGCHAPVHVSKYGNAAGAWMFVNRVNNNGVKAYKPSVPITWNEKVYFFDTTNDTTKLGVSLATLGGGTVHWAWTNITGNAVGILSTSRYMVCFNCHFLTTNPAQAGLTKMIQGKTMIGIPEFALKVSPHEMTESALKEASSGSDQLVSFKSTGSIGAASGIAAAIGIAGLVLWRRRSNSV
ncbi:MAG: hypothetical protein M1503_04750 [Thaumarchaeota archaeon]|nr:hypothetical protein [Nitrososphaerota archaeon]